MASSFSLNNNKFDIFNDKNREITKLVSSLTDQYQNQSETRKLGLKEGKNQSTLQNHNEEENRSTGGLRRRSSGNGGRPAKRMNGVPKQSNSVYIVDRDELAEKGNANATGALKFSRMFILIIL